MTNKTEYSKIKHVKKTTPEEVAEVMETPKMRQMVSQAPKQIKKGLIERMVVALIGPDGLPRVGRYITKELAGPALKNLLLDSLQTGAQMLIFKGDPNGGPNRGGYNQPRNSRASYSNDIGRGYANRYQSSSARKDSTPSSNSWMTDPNQTQELAGGVILYEWAIPDRQGASRIYDALKDYAHEYGNVKVGDYYDALGITTVFTDYNYGWRWDSLQSVRIRAVSNGYVLDLPPVEVI